MGWNSLKQIARFHEVWALTHSVDRSSIEQGLAEESITNIHLCYVGLPSWLRPLLRYQGGHQFYYHLWQIRAYFAAKSLHKRLAFDLFHHITYANDWLASFIGAFLPIPYMRGPGGGAHRTPKGFEREYPRSGRLWELVRSAGQWILRRDPFFVKGQGRARAILVCNRESMSIIPSKWSSKVHMFPVTGVSSEDLAMVERSKPSDGRFRIISVGALIRIKGFALALKAFKEFSDRHPDSEFTIIGSGPEEPRLREAVRRSDMTRRVNFVQWLPRDEVLSRMASSDVFLFPSLRDGGGAVVVEAMAAGTPVVCLDAGGPGMNVTDECGIKIVPATPGEAVHELAGALERLYLDEPMRLRMSKAGRERAAKEYHWDKLGDRMMEIYKQVLSPEGNA